MPSRGPHPSTLAAQLVEDIAPSTKSSTRSDENAELKGFFAKIQRIKDNPGVLKTLKDRVEHNHMLIYVYCWWKHLRPEPEKAA